MASFADGTFKPDLGVQADRSFRMQTSQYGDGYKQTTLDGANPLEQTFRVSFTNRPRYLIMQMDQYLQAQRGMAFPFLMPATGETIIVQCLEWSITWDDTRIATSDAFGSLSATFTKFNGLWIQ